MNTANAWPRANAIHLVLSSLGAVVVDAQGVRSVRAQMASSSARSPCTELYRCMPG